MKTFLVLFIILAGGWGTQPGVRSISAEVESEPETCTDEYKKLGELHNSKHTMCKYEPTSTGRSGVTEDEIKEILAKHNSLRANPNPGAELGATAAAMPKVVWDPHIAEIAQYLADACSLHHDPNRLVPGYGNGIGQNAGWGFGKWEDLIQYWYDEVKDFNYNVSADGAWHYTQVVHDTTTRIGCGFAEGCDHEYNRTLFCNYMKGQMTYRILTPFEAGESCSKCQTCDGNLCTGDCEGMACYNGGVLDTQSCTCTCAKPYVGEYCEILSCPIFQSNWCKSLTEADCSKLSNVPGVCPILCGLCHVNQTAGDNYLQTPAVTVTLEDGSTKSYPEGSVVVEFPECNNKQCQNGGTLDTTVPCTCSCVRPYVGENCEEMDCPDVDGYMCGNGWPESYCANYTNVPEDCPYMCGICEHNCGDKKCLNGGTMNYLTCECSCKKPYTGETCETSDCPESDPWYCGTTDTWQPSACTDYSNGPETCPYMCDACTHECGDKACLNGGTMNYLTCECSCKNPYTGDTCDTAICPESDPYYCGTTDTWQPSACTKYSNGPETCPYMCGVCEESSTRAVSEAEAPQASKREIDPPIIADENEEASVPVGDSDSLKRTVDLS